MKRIEAATNKVIQEEDLSGLIEDADAIFSQYIRLKYANDIGIVSCFTCGFERHWTFQQNGHYIKRSHLYLRWDERHCRPQCIICNEVKHGNIPVFAAQLEAQSPGITEILHEEMRIIHKPTRDELRQIISDYTPKVKELKKKIQDGR